MSPKNRLLVAHKMRYEMCVLVFIYATHPNRIFWNFALYTACCPTSDTSITSVYPINVYVQVDEYTKIECDPKEKEEGKRK